MKFKYGQQLVLQFPANDIKDYDALLEIENRIIATLGNVGEVDGHDMGSGEMNIFVHTDFPKLAFERIKSTLGTDSSFEFKAAYRDIGKDDFTILHPQTLRHFRIV